MRYIFYDTEVELSLERLRGLQRVLPEQDDVDCLRAFDGDVGRLGTAEKFYLELSQLPQSVLELRQNSIVKSSDRTA